MTDTWRVAVRESEIQAGPNRLHAEVILFVDHDAHGLLAIHHGRAPFASLHPTE